jgi:integrase
MTKYTRKTKYSGVFEDLRTHTYGATGWETNPKSGARRQWKRRGFARAADARDYRNKRLRACQDGTNAAPSRTTVAELFEADLDVQVKLGKMKPSTAYTYRRLFDRYVKPRLGRIRAQELRPSQLDALYGDLLNDARHYARSRRGPGLARGTVATVHAMLSGVFSRAAKRGDLALNPCQRASAPSARAAETPVLSLEQTQEFFAHEAVRADLLYPMLKLMAATGLRRGEACGLMRDDVDLDAGVIFVRHNAVPVGSEVVIGSPKTRRSRRRVTLGADSVELLRGHLAAQREHRLMMGAGWRDHGLVFPALDGRPHNPGTVSSRFKSLVRAAGLPEEVSLHSLRHAHGTLCLEQGMPIHVVAQRLGHNPSVLLNVYAHAGDESQDVAAGLEGLLDGERPPLRAVPDAGDEPDEPEALAEDCEFS